MNKFKHNGDGTTTIIIKSKKHGIKKVCIDTEDWDKVKDYNWSLTTPKKNGNCYAKTQINHPNGGWISCNRDGKRRRKTVLQMHHLIIGKPPGNLQTDHIDGNGLNNSKENLHHVTPLENSWNRVCKNKTGFKGVRKYKVKIYNVETYKYGCKISGKHITSWLDTPEEAAVIFDKAVVGSRPIINPQRQLNFPERLDEYLKEITTDEK